MDLGGWQVGFRRLTSGGAGGWGVTLASRLTTFANRLSTLASRLPTLASRLPILTSRLPDSRAACQTFQAPVRVASRLATLASRLATLASRLATLASRLDPKSFPTDVVPMVVLLVRGQVQVQRVAKDSRCHCAAHDKSQGHCVG